jgi:hypothetical protein
LKNVDIFSIVLCKHSEAGRSAIHCVVLLEEGEGHFFEKDYMIVLTSDLYF